MNAQLILQGALYTIIGALTPIGAVLASDTDLSSQRTIATMIVTGLIAGATALKAFLSTTFADSPESVTPGRTLRLERRSKR